MVMTFVLASPRTAPAVAVEPAADSRRFWLESWDGSLNIPLSGMWRGPLEGSTGLDAVPVEVITSGLPGVAGTTVTDVLIHERPVVLVLSLNTISASRRRSEQKTALDAQVALLRALMDPSGMTPDGNFRLVCSGPAGVRQLGLAYLAGLEGDGHDLPHYRRFVIQAVAPQPYAEDREARSVPFRVAPDSTPGLGATWGTVGLTTTNVLATDTPVQLYSAVPVHPRLALTGPATSVLVEGSNGLLIDVPSGLGVSDTLVIDTNPRRKSIRLNGSPAAAMLARGSRTPAFNLGTTFVSVTAPGATNGTVLTLGWRGLHRSLS